MVQPALLLVLSDPGLSIAIDDFEDWYNNEHIPLRVAVPAFLSWARLEAVDGEGPPYAAIYDLSSFQATHALSYTMLAETRSDREKRIFANARLFDRRTYELHDDYPIHSSSPDFAGKLAPITVFRGLEAKEGADSELCRWYNEEHIPMLSKCPGWVRSRWFTLKESQYVGVEADNHTVPPPKYLAIHEWTSLDFEGSSEFKAALSTSWREAVMRSVVRSERRVFKLHKQWERSGSL